MNTYDRFCDLLDKSDVGRALAQQAWEAIRRTNMLYVLMDPLAEVQVLADWFDEQQLEVGLAVVLDNLKRWRQRFVIGLDPASGAGDAARYNVLRSAPALHYDPPTAEVWAWWPEHIPLGGRLEHATFDLNPADLYVNAPPSRVSVASNVCRHERTHYSWLGNRLDLSVYRAPGCRYVYVVLHRGSVTLDEARRAVEMEEADRARTRSRASFTRDVLS